MKSPNHICAALLLFLSLASFRIAAQENSFSDEAPADISTEDAGAEYQTPGENPEAEDPAATVFYIRNISFDTTGITRQFALRYHAEIAEGERIIGRENLENYRLDKVQLLMNQRALEFADVLCFEGVRDEDGSVPVDLLIITRDTWNIIALPEPKYDDNTGFELTLKARDYNFLGTLTPLRVDIGYTLDADKIWDFSQGAFNFKLDSDIPFKVLGLHWNLNFDHEFSYTNEEPLYYQNITGLSMELPASFTTFIFGIDQYITINEDNEDAYPDDYNKDIHGDRFLPAYFSSTAYVSWKIPTPLAVGPFGKLTYTPKVAGRINYLPPGQDAIDDLRRGPTATLSHSLSFSRIDWIDNYRRGLGVSVGNGNTYNFYKEDWDNSFDVSAVYHHIFAKFFGISGRIQYRHWLNNYTTSAGDVIRGILDKSLYADYMLSLNLDFPFRILQFVPSRWFNKSGLRLIDFDLHFSPFLDIALLQDPVNDTEFLSKPTMGAGVELIVFPHFFRSFYLRASFGYDLKDIDSSRKWKELFIGIGHYY
jgi:hypothetical protein